MYGNTIGQSLYSDHISVIGDIEVTPAGNTAIRIGSLTEGSSGWTQVEHVVLTPSERLALGRELVGNEQLFAAIARVQRMYDEHVSEEEDLEDDEYWGAKEALNDVLNVLQILAHDGEPAQGTR